MYKDLGTFQIATFVQLKSQKKKKREVEWAEKYLKK